MPNITYPNQKTVRIHREIARTDFLGIKNENWQAAARDLRPHALLLYLYLASNANNYALALSPAAVRQAVGMPQSTFRDQLQTLIDKGYLVHSHGNTFDFYEIPQTRVSHNQNENNARHNADFEDESTTAVSDMTNVVKSKPPEDIQINNTQNGINIESINIDSPSRIEAPKVKEIVIQMPQVEAKKRPQPIEKKYNTFDF